MLRYNDILQGDYFEDYFLLAFKSLSWLDWTRRKCHKVEKRNNLVRIPWWCSIEEG